MKVLHIITGSLLTLAIAGHGQVSNPSIIPVASAPTGACTAGLPNQQVISTGVQYSCQGGTWAAIGSGGTIGGTIADTQIPMGNGTNTIAASPLSVDNSASPTLVTSSVPFKTTGGAGSNTTPFSITGYSLTGSGAVPMMNFSGTWNTTGTPTLLKANITDTASNASSLLFDFQKGGVSLLSLRKDGVLMFGDATNAIYNGGNGQLFFGNSANPTLAINNSYPGNSSLSMSSVGLIGWSHVAGPMNSIDVALSRTNAGQVKVSAYDGSGPIATGGSLVTNPCTVANLPVGVDGARAFVTDSTLPLNGTNLGAAVVGGGSNHVPVYYDGGASAWKIGG